MDGAPSFDSFPSPPPHSPPHQSRPPPSFDSFPEPDKPISRKRSHKDHTIRIKNRHSSEPRDLHKPQLKQGSPVTEADSFLNALSKELPNTHHHSGSKPKRDGKKAKLEKHDGIKDKKTRKAKHSAKVPSSTTSTTPTTVHHPKPNNSNLAAIQSLSSSSSQAKPVFTIDLKEDTFNLHHGRPDRGRVPHYRRAAGGRVLGLHPHFRITLASAYRGDGLQLSQDRRSKAISISDPAVLHLLNDKNLKRISLLKAQAGQTPDAPPGPFIPLVDRDRHPPQQDDQQKHPLLGINLFEEPESDEDDWVDYAPPDQDGGESFLDQLNRRKTELERRTRDDPGDVETWLALVGLQDEMKELGLVGLRARAADVDEEAVRRHVRGTSDLKLSYLKQALQVESIQGNERLLLGYIKAYCDQPDVNAAREWRRMLDAHPSVTGLWIAYADWNQTEAGSMNVPEMVEVYEELLDRLVRRTEDPSVSEKERSVYEQSNVYLFHRCCIMLKQAGYAERATAAFQAIMEVNFLRPLQHIQSLNEIIEELESFWDSEAARIGENGAKGWMNTNLEDCPLTPLANYTNTDHASPQRHPFEKWQVQELQAEWPTRTDDLRNNDDPFGCVLFDDLRNLLFLVTTFDSQQALLYSFLSFIGVPIPPPDVDTNIPFFTDPFLSSELIDNPARQSLFWPLLEPKTLVGVDGVPESLPGIKKPQSIPFRVFPSDIRQLFAEPSQWFVSFEPPMAAIEFIRNAFRILRTSPALKQDVYFNLCELSFESRIDISSAAKLAKDMLGADPSNVVLWDAYARVCLLRGKPKQARDVYVKTLEMVAEGAEGLMSVWYSWAEMEFQLGNSALVISILARAMKCLDESPSELAGQIGQVRSAAVLLRARRAFTGHLAGSFHHDVPTTILRSRIPAAVAFATFQYLTEGFSAACSVYNESLSAVAEIESSVEEEELWINYCRLIYFQIIRHQSYKPLEIRGILRRAVERYRNNSVFLALFAFNESKMKIDNETRRLIDSILLKTPSSTTAHSWLYAVWVEMHLNASGYNQTAVRSLFERALTSPSTRSCLQIWKLYIEFEIKNDNLTRAKSLITRSHAACPWSKDLYLLPFSSRLKAVYSGLEDQKRMLKLADEKGIRIKDRSIYEIIRKLEEKLLERDTEEEDPVEAAERKELEERLRLLPY